MDDTEKYRPHSIQENSKSRQSKRKVVPKINELILHSSVDSGTNKPKIKEQMRRMSTNPQDYLNGSGIPTEPASPAKPGKLLGKNI